MLNFVSDTTWPWKIWAIKVALAYTSVKEFGFNSESFGSGTDPALTIMFGVFSAYFLILLFEKISDGFDEILELLLLPPSEHLLDAESRSKYFLLLCTIFQSVSGLKCRLSVIFFGEIIFVLKLIK